MFFKKNKNNDFADFLLNEKLAEKGRKKERPEPKTYADSISEQVLRMTESEDYKGEGINLLD